MASGPNGEPILGSISLLGFTWPMEGWALADGALLPIEQNDALYSIFGASFGGSDSPNATSFGLPKLVLPNLVDPNSPDPAMSYQVCLNGTYPLRS